MLICKSSIGLTPQTVINLNIILLHKTVREFVRRIFKRVMKMHIYVLALGRIQTYD